ncbi:MAG: AI-2E family transporter [Phycisphaerales bacterium]|nr:AI-2E family transporter [Phycisphaerales bacterium]
MSAPPSPASSRSPSPGSEQASSASTPTDWRRTHLWQIQPVRDLMLIALVVVVVWLGYQVRLVTVPLLLALLLAYLFEPLVRAVTKRGWFSRKGTAVGIIAAVVLAVLVPLTVGLGFAVVQTVGFASTLSRDIRVVLNSVDAPDDPGLRQKIKGEAWRDIRDWLVEHRQAAKPGAPAGEAQPGAGEGTKPAGEAAATAEAGHAAAATDHGEASSATLMKSIMTWTEQNASGIASTLGKRAVGGGAQAVAAVITTFLSVGAFVFSLLLTMFFFFFFSTGWGRVLAWAEKFIPEAGRYRWMRIIKRMDRAIAGFVRGRLTICAIEGVFMTGAFWFIGLPAPLLLGPLVGAMFLVPFVPALMVPVNILLLWLQSDAAGFRAEWWWIVFAPVGCHICGQILDDYILTPRIQGDNTDLEMPTILFASLAGGALAGVYGLLLAIPVAACLKILATEFLWPRVEKWVKGEVKDPLPIARE